jgi:peptidoglycan hydrolase-like protein with peptidoglycan-binding domain
MAEQVVEPGPTGLSRPRHRTAVVGLVLIGAVVAWAVAAGPLRHSPSGGPTTSTLTMGTVAVVRTDVGERQQVAGILGYAGSLTVVGQQSGIVTAIAAPGAVVRAGGRLAAVDGRPVVLMTGQIPAWRVFGLGMPDGPDVRQLESGLRALGFDPDRAMTVDDHFDAATAAAVRRWQHALGEPQTGSVAVGSVVFLPGPIRVTEDQVLLGGVTGPGQPVLSGTTTDHQVTVALATGQQSLVHVGDRVVVTLPDGTTTTSGRVTFVSQVATSGSPDGGTGGSGGSGGSAQGAGNGQATVEVTVALDDQGAAGRLDQALVQVAITDQLHRGVLAVPVTALVAISGGGYAVTRPDGSVIRVTVGLFDDLTQLVEVSGPGIAQGVRVQVPQP